jgi:hypothetical protein
MTCPQAGRAFGQWFRLGGDIHSTVHVLNTKARLKCIVIRTARSGEIWEMKHLPCTACEIEGRGQMILSSLNVGSESESQVLTRGNS